MIQIVCFSHRQIPFFPMSSTEPSQPIDHGIPEESTDEWTTPLVNRHIVIPSKRKCGHCGVNGHNKRTCPQLLLVRELIVVVDRIFYFHT